jgi:hypothetical protein
VAAGRRSDGMALFGRLCHFVGFQEATVSSDVCRQNRRQPKVDTSVSLFAITAES